MSTTPKTQAVDRDTGVTRTGCPIRHDIAGSDHSNRAVLHIAAVLYGGFSYMVFLAVFVYAIGFVADIAVPRSIDRAIDAPFAQAVLIDLSLLTLFALQHSVMARPAFKRWWTRWVPAAIERSTYVLLASAALALLCWQWRSIATTVWEVDSVAVRAALTAVGWAGWAIVLASTFMIDHFELFGVRQVLQAWRSKPLAETGFRTVLFYKLVRHPLMLGFLIAFWATPTMTAGHLLFAVVTTGYILVALQLEERDLIAALGEPYRHYRRRVPMLLPRLWR
jgi:protein-S-isoprenylcysteine O-methyltransferase Ste14